MPYNLKRAHVKNWDLTEPNQRVTFDDNYDSPTPKPSPVPAPVKKNDTPRKHEESVAKNQPAPHVPSKSPINDRGPPGSVTPRQESRNSRVREDTVLKDTMQPLEPHSLRYYYNTTPENGVPVGTEPIDQKKEEKDKETDARKARTGQGKLAPFPQTGQPQGTDNYYPYWYSYKMKNPDWLLRHRQTTDGQLVPYDYVDPAQYVQGPGYPESLITSRQLKNGAHRYPQDPVMRYNPATRQYELVQNPSTTPNPNSADNFQPQGPFPDQNVPLNGTVSRGAPDSYRPETQSRQRGKLQTERDWADHYAQTARNKSVNDSRQRIASSNPRRQRPGHRVKVYDLTHPTNTARPPAAQPARPTQSNPQPKSSPRSLDFDAPPPHQSTGRHRYRHTQKYPTHHLRSDVHDRGGFQVTDVSFKRPEAAAHFQPMKNSFHSSPPTVYKQNSFYLPPPPAIYNQSAYLPPLGRDTYHRASPMHFYRKLPRDDFARDWKDSMQEPKTHVPTTSTKFYDIYLSKVVEKRIAA